MVREFSAFTKTEEPGIEPHWTWVLLVPLLFELVAFIAALFQTLQALGQFGCGLKTARRVAAGSRK
jgi:hypothetical protein